MSRARAMGLGLALLSGLACRATPQAGGEAVVAQVATVSGDAGLPPPRVLDGGEKIATHEALYELLYLNGLCVRIAGAVHCRQKVTPEQPLVNEPPTLGRLGSPALTSVAFGRDFGCATTQGGEVLCQGGNDRGQLGAGLRATRHDLPLTVTAVHGASRVFAGGFTACALLGDGRLSCWGKNDAGENGSSTNYLSAARELVLPEVVRGVSDVTSVAMAWDTTCAVTRQHEVYCWGRARTEQQRTQRGETNESPVRIDALMGTTFLTANEGAFCAVIGGDVRCFGDASSLVASEEAFGGGQDRVSRLHVKNARKVSLGGSHGCVLDADGSVFCFGLDSDGVLGKPSLNDYTPHLPEKIEGLPRAVDIVCGGALSCAVTVNDETWCWGRFSWAEQGAQSTPTKVKIVD